MILVTFSGLDGCGKSTQVRLTCEALRGRGLKVYRLVTLFTSITGVLTLWRESRKRRAQRAGRTPSASALATSSSSSPSLPPLRTYASGRTFDQDRQRFQAKLQRWLAYPLDCAALSLWLLIVRCRGYNAIVCDRYIYDKMVNLPKPECLLSRLMIRLTPRPNCAVFLSVQPEVAEARRPEHTGDYFRTKDAAYRQVLAMNTGLTAIAVESAEKTQARIMERIPAPKQTAPTTCERMLRRKNPVHHHA